METRTIVLDLERANEDGIPATLSTQHPVARDGYQEVLLHEPDAVSFRGGGSTLPLLVGHQSGEPAIGRVDNLQIWDQELKGVLRFGSSQRACELREDIEHGIVTDLPVGYSILKQRLDEDTLFATRREVHEASLVGVGADPNAQTYREIPMEEVTEIDTQQPLPILTTPTPERERAFSLVNGIRGVLDPRFRGFEHEVSQELSRTFGEPRTPGGFWMPLDSASQRVMTAATAGSSTIQTTILDRIVDYIIRASIWPNLGLEEFNGLSDNLKLPKGTSSVTTSFLSLDGSTNITEATPTLGSVTLSPTSLASFVQVSHKMLLQSGASVEQYLRSLMGRAIGNQLDYAIFVGGGSSNEPTGVLNAAGVSLVTYTTLPTWADILGTVEALEADAISYRNAVWVINPAQISDLGSIEKATNTAKFLMDFGSGRNGAYATMGGFPVYVSEHVTAGKYIFGAFEHSAIGFFSPVEIAVDQNYDFQKANTGIRAILDFDYQVVNASGFCKLST